MPTALNPYLAFPGNAAEAMAFYSSVFGGDLVTTTFGEGGMAEDPATRDKLMHAQLTGRNGLVLMASDGAPGMPLTQGDNVSVSLSGDDEAELRGYWDGLSDGATVTMALERAPWGDVFGMCTDRFGIHWMVNITPSTG